MKQFHSGFTLIAAIFLLLFVAIAMSLMLSYTSQTIKQTGHIYLKEQAVQLSRSATEFALLAISGHDRATGCVNYINTAFPETNPIFDINTTIKYFHQNALANCEQLSSTLQTKDSEGTVLIDVFVTRIRKQNTTDMPISYHKRTLQKP